MATVALLNLWTPPYVDGRTGGMVYAFPYLRKLLKDTGHQADCFHPPFPGETKGLLHEDYLELPPTEEGARVLNTYDCVLVSSGGSFIDRKAGAWWHPLLEGLRVPFALMAVDPAELLRTPYRHQWLRHPKCLALAEHAVGMADVLGDPKSLPRWYLPHCRLEAQAPQGKERIVVSVNRATNRKRIIELVSIAPQLAEHDYALRVYGANSMWQYVRKMRAINSEWWTYGGTFPRTQLGSILGPARYHWCAIALHGKANAQLLQRVEHATVEAVGYGCCPILSRATTPSYYDDQCAVFVNPLDGQAMNQLAGVLRERENEASACARRFAEVFNREERPAQRADELVRWLAAQ